MAAAGPSRPTEMINASVPSLKARLDLPSLRHEILKC